MSIHSQEQFENEMGMGWMDGLMLRYPHEITFDYQIYVHRLLGLWQCIGDIDLVARVGTPKPLSTLFPVGSCSIQPNGSQAIEISGFICEIKRTCDAYRMEEKLRQFVTFYNKYLSATAPTQMKSRDGSNKVVSPALLNMISDVNTPLLFVFNGTDNVTVWNRMQVMITNICGTADGTMIHGHRVFTIFCLSHKLIEWQLAIHDAEATARAEQEAQRAEQEAQRAEQEAQRAEQLRQQLRELGINPIV